MTWAYAGREAHLLKRKRSTTGNTGRLSCRSEPSHGIVDTLRYFDPETSTILSSLISQLVVFRGFGFYLELDY